MLRLTDVTNNRLFRYFYHVCEEYTYLQFLHIKISWRNHGEWIFEIFHVNFASWIFLQVPRCTCISTLVYSAECCVRLIGKNRRGWMRNIYIYIRIYVGNRDWNRWINSEGATGSPRHFRSARGSTFFLSTLLSALDFLQASSVYIRNYWKYERYLAVILICLAYSLENDANCCVRRVATTCDF